MEKQNENKDDSDVEMTDKSVEPTKLYTLDVLKKHMFFEDWKIDMDDITDYENPDCFLDQVQIIKYKYFKYQECHVMHLLRVFVMKSFCIIN